MNDRPSLPTPPSSSSQPDRLAALVSGFVAALAPAVSAYNVYLQRQQICAQVWPRLQCSFSNAGGFTHNLQNSGVGPAEVRGVCLLVDDRPVASWDEALAKLLQRGPGAHQGARPEDRHLRGQGQGLHAWRGSPRPRRP